MIVTICSVCSSLVRLTQLCTVPEGRTFPCTEQSHFSIQLTPAVSSNTQAPGGHDQRASLKSSAVAVLVSAEPSRLFHRKTEKNSGEEPQSPSTPNSSTSSLQSRSMRSAGFSPHSFSASGSAPKDRRYLSSTEERTVLVRFTK